MTRPPIERLYTVLSAIIRQYRINPKVKTIGQLLDVLQQKPDCDDVTTYICQQLHSSEHLTRSCWIDAFLRYIGLQSVATVCIETWEMNGFPVGTTVALRVKKRVALPIDKILTMKSKGWSSEKIARKLNVSESTIARRLRMHRNGQIFVVRDKQLEEDRSSPFKKKAAKRK